MLQIEQAGSIVTLRLNRPEVRNALNHALLARLKSALDDLASSGSVRALILTGNAQAFSAGADLKSGLDNPQDLGEVLDEHYHPLVQSLIDFPAPTIAKVEGVATGAGLSLALLCDVGLVAEDARISLRFSQIGLVPDTGATWTVPRLIGHARAMALMLTGAEITGKEAAKMGMFAQHAPTANLDHMVNATAAHLATGATSTLVRIRKALLQSNQNTLEQQLALEGQLQTEAGKTEDFASAIAAFAQKRPPIFTGK
jgi:2-(1,2-epoxy-1,2-dihydrophenyl)acetyl-CoA isomerase